jgi:hypothetical protein
MFVDPANGDFTPKSGSPVERMNLKVPRASDVGPRAR